MLLVSRNVLQYLLYLTVHRTSGGLWYFQLKTFSPDQYLNDIQYKIVVYKGKAKSDATAATTATTTVTADDPPVAAASSPHKAESAPFSSSSLSKSPMFSYSGSVISHKLSLTEATDSGNFLLLTDWQIKKLKTSDMIFEYKIDVKIAHHNREKPKLLPPMTR